MFKKNEYTILKDLYIGKSIETDALWEEKFLDREGYELNSIEKELYSVNEIPVLVKDRQTRRVPDLSLIHI